MAASDAKYALSTDEVGGAATLTSSVTMNANYPVTNIQNFNPGDVGLTNANISGGWRLVWDFGSAVDAQGFSLHHHNIPAGTSGVIVARNSSNSWGAPAQSKTLTIATYPSTGLPAPIAVDWTQEAGYSTGGFQYGSLFVPALSQLGGVGSALWWAPLRQDISNVRYPVKDAETHLRRVFPTVAGVRLVYHLGVRIRRQPVDFRFKTAAQYAAFLALFRSAQAAATSAFLWWRGASDDDPYLATFDENDLLRELPYNNVSDVSMTIVELSPGFAIPTA